MKAIVVYQSKTGHTKQYAEWIAESLECEAVPLNKVSKSELEECDKVIYGGWLMAGMIKGLNKFLKKGVKSPVIFAVGMSDMSEELIKTIRLQNKLEDMELFYFVGGVDYNKLGFMSKKMLEMVRKSIEAKDTKTENDEYMLKVLGESCDLSDRRFTDELISSLNR